DGRAFLRAIDELSTQPAPLEPALLRDREFLSACDFVEVVCWIGGRLAEALDHAHRQGVLHRDIKPANILFNGYGRPMLADFSLACPSLPQPGSSDSQAFGGTLSYMAAEHLDAFLSRDRAARLAVDERSDLYSLGIVLFEFLTGRLPHSAGKDESGLKKIMTLSAERRLSVPSARQENPEVPEVLDRVIRRCLDPQPERRYQKAADLAQALEGCRQLRQVQKELPAGGLITRLAMSHPFIILILLALLPNILGSVVNISYNSVQIVGALEASQRQTFNHLLIGYNAVTYTICLAVAFWLLVPLIRAWKELQSKAKSEILNPKSETNPKFEVAATDGTRKEHGLESVLDPGAIRGSFRFQISNFGFRISDLAAMRRRVLALPLWAAGLSCIGWLPGGVLFPLLIHLTAGPISSKVFSHFLFSFTISGLIALTYSGLAVQWIVVRVLYPRLWMDGSRFRETARQELTSLDRRLRVWQFLAGIIPLAGAALMVSVGPEEFSLGFRILAVALIALGMAGLGLGLLIGSRIQQILTALVA
ncbi:MAG TPA: serine/threonine-protein kinase, partial [Gemmataceae bacterium]|nr:serine/threonine-protein kinase [Gemmataceae bacterium]